MARRGNSTRTRTNSKTSAVVVDHNRPRKPRPDFPLTAHVASGQWCKKIKGKIYYFGVLADPEAALKLYVAEKDDLYAGRKPARRSDGLRLLELCAKFLRFKLSLVESGELSKRSWYDHQIGCKRLVTVWGENRLVEDLKPQDFEDLRRDFGRTWGAVRIGNEINRTRMVFKYAFESGLIDRPIRFGPAFKRTPKRTLRKLRRESGPRMFEREELLEILGAASQPMKAMVMLGINCGFGNMDVAMLPMTALDLEAGWVDYPRPKTGVERRCPLWPETIAAVKEYLAVRPRAKYAEDLSLAFLSKQRRPWFRHGRFVEDDKKGTEVKGIDNPVAKSFKVLLDKLGINSRRGFYSLRHGFETIAGDTGDQVAVNAVMGHADQSMAAVYRERVAPERLVKVSNHVRAWLFGEKKPAEAPAAG
jgi:integrase